MPAKKKHASNRGIAAFRVSGKNTRGKNDATKKMPVRIPPFPDRVNPIITCAPDQVSFGKMYGYELSDQLESKANP